MASSHHHLHFPGLNILLALQQCKSMLKNMFASDFPRRLCFKPSRPAVLIKSCVCLAAQSCWTLCYPMDCTPPGSFVHGDSPGKNTGMGCHELSHLPNPVIETGFPTSQTNSLLSEPVGKPY